MSEEARHPSPVGQTAHTQRLFFALWPEDSIREALVAAMERLKSAASARWIRSENLHMTLAFLGDVETHRLDDLKAAANAVGSPGFTLRLDRIEWWRKPEVICLTPSTPSATLDRLAADLAANLRAVGFTLETRPYRAHLSLARKTVHLPPDSRLLHPITWTSSSFALVESRPGSDYTILQSWPLSG
ncbi:MAG: RNA 2',3'-cyclic phosphodiesterase [Methylococcaceae bacterium]|nr:RNA 2',3'-cyclic phosphodiesterase [Methylococcaceae bacterium]